MCVWIGWRRGGEIESRGVKRLDLNLTPGVFGFKATNRVVIEMKGVAVVLGVHGGDDKGGGGEWVAWIDV